MSPIFKANVVVACSIMLGACQRTSEVPPPAEQAPAASYQVQALQFGSGVPAPRYDADLHQQTLARPKAWCGNERRDDPLLVDARRIVSGPDSDAMAYYRLAYAIPEMSPDAVSLVRDEAVCERAAKAYDRIFHGIDLLEDHRGLMPALAIKLGAVFIVEEARPRGSHWEVMFFDENWRAL